MYTATYTQACAKILIASDNDIHGTSWSDINVLHNTPRERERYIYRERERLLIKGVGINCKGDISITFNNNVE